MAEKKETLSLFQKLVKLQSMWITVEKNGLNPHFKSKYIILDDIIRAYAWPLSECWLFIFHSIEIADDVNYLITSIVDWDDSTQSISTRFPMPKTWTFQSMGSNLTYSKRYNLWQLLNIAESDDDDWNTAWDVKKVALTSAVIDKVKEAIKSWNYTKTLQECIDDLTKKYIVSDEQKKIVEWLYTKIEEIVEEAK